MCCIKSCIGLQQIKLYINGDNNKVAEEEEEMETNNNKGRMQEKRNRIGIFLSLFSYMQDGSFIYIQQQKQEIRHSFIGRILKINVYKLW